MNAGSALVLSLERQLFAEADNGYKARMVEYGKHFSHFYIIVHSTRKHGTFSEVRLGDNVTVIPTNGRNIILSYKKMLAIGKKICRDQKIGLIISQDPFATGLVAQRLSKKFRVPFSVNLYSSFFDNPFWIRERRANVLLNRLGKWVCKRATSVRVECPTERRVVEGLGVKPERIFVVPVPVPLARFGSVDAAQLRAELLDNGKYDSIVLYVGRLAPEKDIETLLRTAPEVLGKHPRTRYVIVGGGPQEDYLKQLVKQLGIESSVLFTGRQPYDRVAFYYRACDVFVLPSLYEGIPLVAVEASAAGKPIVITDLRDAPDVIKDGETGFIVRQRDHQAMAEKISWLLSHPIDARKMGEAGQRFVVDFFDPERNFGDLIANWKKTAEMIQ